VRAFQAAALAAGYADHGAPGALYPSGAQIYPSRCAGGFVDQYAEPVAALEPIGRVRTGKAEASWREW
jgi:hypothetical protein